MLVLDDQMDSAEQKSRERIANLLYSSIDQKGEATRQNTGYRPDGPATASFSDGRVRLARAERERD